jgi:hypothetical protein
MSEQPAKRRDAWDKVNILLHPMGGLFTGIAIALLGFITSNALNRRQAVETNTRLYSELMSRREESESALRKDMCVSIIASFVNPRDAALSADVLNLEMLAYNFHESLNLKPLFAHMNRQIVTSSGSDKASFVMRLNQVAREITNRQMLLLEQVGKKIGRTVDFEKLKDSPGGIELEPDKLLLDDIEREFMLSVIEFDPEKRELTLELGVRTPQESINVQRRTFRVGYYDFPMIDNTRLSRDQRVAVVVNQVNEGGADITLVYFPGSYASLRERVSYDEVVEKLRETGGQ